MNTMLAVSTKRQRNVPPAGTLARRVFDAMDSSRAPDGSPWSMRSLSLAAGLSPSHVEQVISGRQQSISEETALAIARATGCSAEWLIGRDARGIEAALAIAPLRKAEPMQRIDIVYADDSPSRAAAIALWEAVVGADVARSVRLIRLKSDQDPGEAFWEKELKERHAKRKKYEAELAREEEIARQHEVQPEPGDRMPPEDDKLAQSSSSS